MKTISARDLIAGMTVIFKDGRAQIASVERSNTLVGGSQFKTAAALRIGLDDGRELMVHPQQTLSVA